MSTDLLASTTSALSAPPPSPAPLQNVTTCYNSDDRITTKPPAIQELPEAPRPDPSLNSRQLLAAHTKPLTTQQRSAIDLLIAGRSDAAAAAALNLHRVTITRWRLYNHVFQAELNRRRHEVYGAAADKLRATLARAVRVFQKQIRSDDQRVAFRAARALLCLAGNNRLAVPPDPAVAPGDPLAVLDLEARRVHVQLCSIDPRHDPLDDDDRALALRTLLHRDRHNPLPVESDDSPGNLSAPQTSNPPSDDETSAREAPPEVACGFASQQSQITQQPDPE